MKKNEKEKTRRSIIDALKNSEGLDAGALAEMFSLTPMAIRLQLYDLREAGLVEERSEARPKGRPAKIWSLTSAADSYFPDTHSKLLIEILDGVEEAFGEKGVDTLTKSRGEKQIERYLEVIGETSKLRTRLDRLAKLRTLEGYMAEVQKEGDGIYLLIENHCPICAAATRCRGFCVSELEVFQTVIGQEYSVERTKHILEGARRCVYRVCKK